MLHISCPVCEETALGSCRFGAPTGGGKRANLKSAPHGLHEEALASFVGGGEKSGLRTGKQ